MADTVAKIGGATGHGWIKGKSGNPSGGRSKKILTEQLRLALNEYAKGDDDKFLTDEDGNKIKYMRKIATQLVKNAAQGDIAAAKECFDRVEGKARQPITGDDDAPPLEVIHRVVVSHENAQQSQQVSSDTAPALPAPSPVNGKTS